MQCPLCGSKTRVDNVISSRGRSTRQRVCESRLCRVIFHTIEIPTGPEEVVKAARLPHLAALIGGDGKTVPDESKRRSLPNVR